MKLIFLIGNSAVGKMTVGQELAKLTDLKLFHNHMTIEPVIDLFGDKNAWNCIHRLRLSELCTGQIKSSADFVPIELHLQKCFSGGLQFQALLII